jgi:hypothetical protein
VRQPPTATPPQPCVVTKRIHLDQTPQVSLSQTKCYPHNQTRSDSHPLVTEFTKNEH